MSRSVSPRRCRWFGHAWRVRFGRELMRFPDWIALSGSYPVVCKRCGISGGRFPRDYRSRYR